MGNHILGAAFASSAAALLEASRPQANPADAHCSQKWYGPTARCPMGLAGYPRAARCSCKYVATRRGRPARALATALARALLEEVAAFTACSASPLDTEGLAAGAHPAALRATARLA